MAVGGGGRVGARHNSNGRYRKLHGFYRGFSRYSHFLTIIHLTNFEGGCLCQCFPLGYLLPSVYHANTIPIAVYIFECGWTRRISQLKVRPVAHLGTHSEALASFQIYIRLAIHLLT